MNISAGPFLYLPCTHTVSLKLNPDLIEHLKVFLYVIEIFVLVSLENLRHP